MKRLGLTYWTGFFAFFLLALAVTAAPAAAQDNGCPDQQEVALHYSLYYENFKNDNFSDALPDLHWVLENCPGFPRDKDTNFERAVEAYEGLAESADSPEQKRAYLDSALVMFDRAVPTLQGVGAEVDEFQWTRDKGRFIQNHLDDLDDMKGEVIKAYRKIYELDPKRTDAYYIDFVLSDYYSNDKIAETITLLNEVNDTRGEEPDIKKLVEKYLPLIPDDKRITFLEAKFAEDATDLETAKQLFALYRRNDMTDKMNEMAPKLLEMEPNPAIVRLLQKLAMEQGDMDRAVELFKQLETMEGAEVLAEDYMNMGIATQEQGDFGGANSYYRKALEVNPEYNQARVAIANLYATAVSKCGVSDREGKDVFWLVADAYSRAGDSAGAARYRSAFPSAEDVFYVQKWEKGATVSVSYGCRGLTISGSTTVRTSN
ncbi:MAG TPA: hypothetical protein VKP65_12330 [Rhodothermales bacterium]|nr:hypothetical protein [Rhodothermales bacterium]